jgi:hypothetical protein
MAINDPIITVSCDAENCRSTEEFDLTSLARGGWDQRNVIPQLKKRGWTVDGDRTICPDCSEEVEP